MLIKKRRYPFYLSITVLAVLLVVVLTGIFFWISRKESTGAALKTADQLFAEVDQKMLDRYEHALSAVAGFTSTAVRMPQMVETPEGDGLSHPGLPVMLEALRYYNYLFSVYAGYADGTFFQIVAPRGKAAILQQYQAPPNTRFIVRTICVDNQGQHRQNWRFLDENEQVVGRRDGTAPSYDPRQRPWFRQALKSDSAGFTAPYLFNQTGLPGVTCFEQLPGAAGVLGADITLERFAQSLEAQKVSKNSALFLFDKTGNLFAHSRKGVAKAIVEKDRDNKDQALRFLKAGEVEDPVIRVLTDRSKKGEIPIDQTQVLTIDHQRYLAHLSSVDPALGFQMMIGSVAPLSDFTGHIRRMQYQISVSSLIVLVLIMPLIFLGSRRLSMALILLGKEADKVRKFDFSAPVPFDSIIKEIHSLVKAFNLMRITIQQRTDALIATQKKLEKLVQSGIALSAEQDVDRLMEMIFSAAGALSNTDGGALYLRDKDDRLNLTIMQTAARQIIRSGEIDAKTVRPVPLFDPNSGEENHAILESHVALTGKTMAIDGGKPNGFDFSATYLLDESTGPTWDTSLTVPLKPRQEAAIGVLQLFNARDAESGDLLAFDQEIVGFVEALAAQAAIALHNKNLLEAQRNLFNAFIQLIAGAIDAKSPYTGGHCARVPEIAMMLAEAAHNSTDEPFKDFHMDSPDQWHEFKVAAWLHDCGKVTTPEYVVDKATKLETIYNRIHEIRTRFEVLWRDAEILFYKELLEGRQEKQQLEERLHQTQSQLKKDFAFVAQCNVGGEFMADEALARLNTIAERKWLRHFDDRIGLSQDELDRKSHTQVRALPADELLLADKPEHIISRGGVDPLNGNPHGFKMDVPKALYNQGELYNLGIRKGTLTAEERFKINEHIVQTYLMLKRLPFPKHMQTIPDVAASHHETMIGTGYPRKLSRDDMPLPARIIAVADIFEALTASDRPYKQAKTLSDSLRIMSFMRNDQHIDAELFDLFLTSGVYKKYADKFLKPEQIDEVDIRNYLSTQQ